MRTKSLFLLLSLALLTTACSMYHVSSEDTSLSYYPSKPTTKDINYLEEVPKPHEVVGFVIVNAERRQKRDEVIERMKREAAILGGDAITNLQSDATGEWKRLPVQQLVGNAYIRSNYRATVVVFK